MRTMTITMCQARGTGLLVKAVKAGTPTAMPGGTRGRQQHPAEHAYRIR